MKKLLITILTLAILCGCNQSKLGEYVYLEPLDKYTAIIHSDIKCKKIKNGVIQIPSQDGWSYDYDCTFCSECFDEELIIKCKGKL